MNNMLFLFDEIGSGIELNEGVVFVIVILEKFYYMGCIMVVIMYYGEIKCFLEIYFDFMNVVM